MATSSQSVKKIFLDKGYEALVDAEDYDRLLTREGSYPYKKGSLRRWRAHLWRDGCVYAVACERLSNGVWKQIRMHRIILGITNPLIHVDHIDGNGLNNCKFNLRIVTNRQNLQNCRKYRSPKCTSKYKGVSYRQDCPNAPWLVYVNANGKLHYMGGFKTEKEAALYYNLKAKELKGEYARLNTI